MKTTTKISLATAANIVAIDNASDDSQETVATPPTAAQIAPALSPAQTAPAKTTAELVAERTARLNKMNLIARQVGKLEQMHIDLAKFSFDVNNDDDRTFNTISITDDRRSEFKITNANLAALLVDFLKTQIGQKLHEKQAELMNFQL